MFSQFFTLMCCLLIFVKPFVHLHCVYINKIKMFLYQFFKYVYMLFLSFTNWIRTKFLLILVEINQRHIHKFNFFFSTNNNSFIEFNFKYNNTGWQREPPQSFIFIYITAYITIYTRKNGRSLVKHWIIADIFMTAFIIR